jgi:hypothetical protein
MARVTIVLEDSELTGGAHIEITVSSDPPLPIMEVTDPKWLAGLGGGRQDLDIEKATPAQAAARMAVGEVAGHAQAAALLVRPE